MTVPTVVVVRTPRSRAWATLLVYIRGMNSTDRMCIFIGPNMNEYLSYTC